MITIIGFVILVLALIFSIQIFLSLVFLFIPTLIIFGILLLLGVTIAFWKLYLIVFLAVFVINMFRD